MNMTLDTIKEFLTMLSFWLCKKKKPFLVLFDDIY